MPASGEYTNGQERKGIFPHNVGRGQYPVLLNCVNPYNILHDLG